MKNWSFKATLISAAVLVTAMPAAAQQCGAGKVTIHNLADDFLTFYDATTDLSDGERIARFKTEVGSKFPYFYKPSKDTMEGRKKFDDKIVKNLDKFAELRPQYEGKLETFGAQLHENICSFKAYFEDFDPAFDLYFIHSLGAMDGGTRNLNGVFTFIFGADVIARVHTFENEAPFFHHELFHLYRNTYAKESSCRALWCNVWSEGLATYVARELTPTASHDELLLGLPADLVPGTKARLKFALEDMKSAAYSETGSDYARFLSFKKDDNGLPRRRGYYLGLLVAEEVAKTIDLKTLSHMSFDEVEPHFMKALDVLIEQAE